MQLKYFLIILPAVLTAGCGGSASVEPVDIVRFDTIEASYISLLPDQRDSVISEYAPEIGFLQKLYGLSSADSAMQMVAVSRPVEVFGPDIRARLADLKPVEERLGELAARLPHVLPAVKMPSRLSGIILPYRQSVVVADSLLLVGLNHYLGSDYEGYATFDSYTRGQKTVERMPYHIAEAIVGSTYPYLESEGATALSRMLYEGAMVEVLSQLFPDAAPAQLMGYTEQQMDDLNANESTLWQRIIAGNMLYDVDPMTAARLVEPAASTSVISPDAPPRAGRYLGWRIVRAYMQSHPEVSPEYLLTPRFYGSQQSLKDSGYAPLR
ncbi:MAG: hypothetical protein K2K79_00320 [Paramuribaculum sp.]|nr:hypothetical protein [Paramuribaculum sp.]